MKKSDFHLLENLKTGMRSFYFYDEADFEKYHSSVEEGFSNEFGEDINDFKEIPELEWTESECLELMGNFSEDYSIRSSDWPQILVDVLNDIKDLDPYFRKKLMLAYMNKVIERYVN